VAVTATAVVTAIVPNVHLPAMAGGGSAPAHAPSAAPSTAPGTWPAAVPAYSLTASAVATPTAGKAKHHGRKAKKTGRPKTGKPAGSGGNDGPGYEGDNWNGHGHRHGHGYGNGHGNGDGNGNDPSPTSTSSGGGTGNGNSSGSPSPSPSPTPTVTVSVTSTAGTTADVKLVLTANIGPAVWRVAETALLAGKPVVAPLWHAAGCDRHMDHLTHRDRSCHILLDAAAAPRWGASDRAGQGETWWGTSDRPGRGWLA